MSLDGLIPKKVWQKNPIKGKVTAQHVYDLAAQLKIHPAIIARRVRYERNNYKLLSRHIGNKQVRKCFAESCSEATT
jgi:HTH-type transcriptional regulator/antitoxin HigA